MSTTPSFDSGFRAVIDEVKNQRQTAEPANTQLMATTSDGVTMPFKTFFHRWVAEHIDGRKY